MLSQDFEIYYYSDRTLPTVEAHTHNYYEFYFFIEGNISMHINGETIVPTPGTMLMIPPNVPHYVKMAEAHNPYRRVVFWVTEEFIDGLAASSEDYRYLINHVSDGEHFFVFQFNEISFNEIQGSVFSLIDEIHSNRFGKEAKILLRVSDFILTLNRFVYEATNPSVNPSDSDTLYQTLILYIETHIDEDLSLDVLADQFHLSKFHISHIFTEINGLPIHKYITKKRLDMCRGAILSGQDISAVSETYGFSDYSVFYRAFVKEYGVSPKKYRDEVLRKP